MAVNLTGEKAPRTGKPHTAEVRAQIAATKQANPRRGALAPTWKGGRHLSNGYVMVALSALSPEEQARFAPMASKSSRIPEHRLVVARQIGRPLTRDEHVHHINGVKDDNRPTNLEYHPSNSSHQMKHVEVDAEMYRLRRENEWLRAELSKFSSATFPEAG
jgi:hypothetical protein